MLYRAGIPALLLLLVPAFSLSAKTPSESRDISTVGSAAHWEKERRPEILELFRKNVYGRNPIDRPSTLTFTPSGPEKVVFDGAARRQHTQIAWSGRGGTGGMRLTTYYPTRAKPKGCIILIVNRSRKIIDNADTAPLPFWPVNEIVARGYATAAFHNSEVAPDNVKDKFTSGVFGVFDSKDRPRARDAWATIAAWSWGASRALDFLETQPILKNTPFVVAGHSRGGKAALWCGAQDTRVWLTISNNSGCTGAALALKTTGETVALINKLSPHWFSRNYHTYGDRVRTLPVDQHQLLALMAPRLVYVASASEDAHADPRSEFQACLDAAPVFALYGLKGVGDGAFPKPGEARHEGAIGYHLRPGAHDLTTEDWMHYLDYSDKHLKHISE